MLRIGHISVAEPARGKPGGHLSWAFPVTPFSLGLGADGGAA